MLLSRSLFHKRYYRTFSTQSGTVKYYLREKGYGFIVPDSGGADVFVHRSGLLTDIPLDVSIQHPFLRKGERVRFETIPDAGLHKAVQVTWLNGSPIPPLRRNYLGTVHDRARRILGDHVFEIMNDEDLSEEERQEKIRVAYEYVMNIIANGEALVTRLGMRLEDFPTETTDEPGRYRYKTERSSNDEDVQDLESTK